MITTEENHTTLCNCLDRLRGGSSGHNFEIFFISFCVFVFMMGCNEGAFALLILPRTFI